MTGPRNINFVNVMMFLLIGSGLYLSIKYVPLFWTKQQLSDLLKEESYGGRRKSPEALKYSIIDAAERKLYIELDEEDIQVQKLGDRVKIRVSWWVAVEHPFKKVTIHEFVVDRETVFY